MRYAFGEGGTVLMPGRKYDLGKVIGAAEQIADILASFLGGGKAWLTPDHDGYAQMRWPDPAKAAARQFWLNASELYDGVYEALLIGVGPVKVKWYALGRASVRYDGVSDQVVDLAGNRLGSYDPEPCMVIFGEPNRDVIAAVERAVREPCERLGLRLRMSRPVPAVEGIRVEAHVGLIEFPHESYGDGEGPVRIRCETVQGGD